MNLTVLYEDDQVIVVIKPVGMESQVSKGFEPDMVSEIRKHINKLYTAERESYVGVIHRLDKPVGGVMVYAKTPAAAAALSRQVQSGGLKKKYQAVICGKTVDNVDKYVDYLLKDGKTNCSRIVDKGTSGAKRAELKFRVLKEKETAAGRLTLVEIELITGRHHQIRVQFAGHGTPLWGDHKYNPEFRERKPGLKCDVALAACEISFRHPQDGRTMVFRTDSKDGIFREFIK